MHAGDKICTSGYWGTKADLSATGDEWITVNFGTKKKSQHPYIVKAFGFQAGMADVRYEWIGDDSPECENPVIPPILTPRKALLKMLLGDAVIDGHGEASIVGAVMSGHEYDSGLAKQVST